MKLVSLAFFLLLLLPALADECNLSRTSLASVSASSVNGERALDDPYCGVQKMFDDGQNEQHDTMGNPYSYWMCQPGKKPTSVTILFSVPVTLNRIEITAPAKPEEARDPKYAFDPAKTMMSPDPLTLLLYGADGLLCREVLPVPAPSAEAVLPTRIFTALTPVSGVTRISIQSSEYLIRIDEIRVMGTPPDVLYIVQAPWIVQTSESAESRAGGLYAQWIRTLLAGSTVHTEDADDAFVTMIIAGDGTPLFRVRTPKAGGAPVCEPLVRLAAEK